MSSYLGMVMGSVVMLINQCGFYPLNPFIFHCQLKFSLASIPEPTAILVLLLGVPFLLLRRKSRR